MKCIFYTAEEMETRFGPLLALHEDDFVLYKLNVGVEDIREQ